MYSIPMLPSGSGDASTVATSVSDSERSNVPAESPMQQLMGRKTKRLVDWNVEILSRFLRQIIARRNAAKATTKRRKSTKKEATWSCGKEQVLDEVLEIIELPSFDGKTDDDLIFEPLPEAVQDQLYDYVCGIEKMYNDNPFHNFEHASHVSSTFL